MTPLHAIGDSGGLAKPCEAFPDPQDRAGSVGYDRRSPERRRDPDPFSSHASAAYPAKLNERLVHWARETPGQIFLAKRDAGGAWRTLAYAQTLALVRTLGQALLDRGLGAERPLAILSGNDLEHALLALAAMHVGVPYAPISPAYSLISTDHAKLRYILELLQPGLVFAANGERYARAIAYGRAARLRAGCDRSSTRESTRHTVRRTSHT